MHSLNLFFIPLVLISLYFKIEFAYLIALLCSLAGATFIYTQTTLANISFTIAIFNLTPLLAQRFSLILRNLRLVLKSQRTAAKASYEEMLKEHSLIRQSNHKLTQDISQIVELYRMMRDMSGVLGFEEAFGMLGKKLMEHFRFKRARLILIDEELGSLKIKKVFELKYVQPDLRIMNEEAQDPELLEQSLRLQRVSFLAERALLLAPLTAENRFLGTLIVEALLPEAAEHFSILANQFSLGFRRIRLYQKIQELAITDGLTGLFVRRYFMQRLQEEMKRSIRHHLRLSFLMIDIDHFKQCNDKFGHLTGDVILKETANKIKACVREIDLVARYGGEEFSVLLPDTDKLGARGVAERIRENIEKHKFSAYDETIKIEISIGVAGFPEDATEVPSLIDQSDQALYRAKQAGRNRVMIA